MSPTLGQIVCQAFRQSFFFKYAGHFNKKRRDFKVQSLHSASNRVIHVSKRNVRYFEGNRAAAAYLQGRIGCQLPPPHHPCMP